MNITPGTAEADAMEIALEAAASWLNYAEEYALAHNKASAKK